MNEQEAAAKYELQGRELIAQVEGLRVQVLTLGPGQCIPWHHHSTIADTFFCLSGEVQVETRNPSQRSILHPGERLTVPPHRSHRVTGLDGNACSFVIVQGVGSYDYIADE